MKRRRLEFKTDYRARMQILTSGKPRIVFRKTNRYLIGQYVVSKAAQDSILSQACSRELFGLGWPKNFAGSLKSLPAAYLTGLLLGKRVVEKYGKQKLILDLGLLRNKAKSRIYAFVKGVIDAGIELSLDKKILPDEARIKGSHMKKDIQSLLNTVAKNIENG